MAGGKIAAVGALSNALDANRVTGAPAGPIERPGDCSVELSWFAHPNKPPHRAFGISCSGVDQDSRHLGMCLGKVDPFAKRGRAVSAVEHKLTDQYVRESVE